MIKRFAIVGGGIIGLATAYKLQEFYPGSQVTVFEKEDSVGQHQSGRNSGVLHCGLYYEPGSLKANLAVDGIRQMSEFCINNNIDHDICGKIVTASNDRESLLLDNLAERGRLNGLQGLKFLTDSELKKREPFVRSKKTLLVPQEGIIDYKMVMKRLCELITNSGGRILCSEKVIKVVEIGNEIELLTNNISEKFDFLISCAGLHSDRVYESLTGGKRPLRIVPFRGEYKMLNESASKLVNHLVYPVPDPQFPFLGVHFTRLTNGRREVGPNAVFALKREGYTNLDISFKDTFDSLTYRGFINFLIKNFSFSMGEFASSLSERQFIKKAQKLIPDLNASHLETGTAGVRAQAMDISGKLLMDFNIIRKGRQIHVLNAPSPGATSSLSIADYIIKEYINN
jgi:L-2-hydroxyglutarate oxidase